MSVFGCTRPMLVCRAHQVGFHRYCPAHQFVHLQRRWGMVLVADGSTCVSVVILLLSTSGPCEYRAETVEYIHSTPHSYQVSMFKYVRSSPREGDFLSGI